MKRQQYIQEYERIQRKYRKKFFPAVYKAINSIVSSLIDKIQTDGVNSAMGDLMLTIINDKIGEPVKADLQGGRSFSREKQLSVYQG
jgi:hypothetical protein